MEKITNIKYIENYKDGNHYSSFDGYEIETNLNTRRLLITNSQDCCESFGEICSEDDFNDFLDAEILSVEFSDCAEWDEIELTKKEFGDTSVDVLDCGFIDFKTSKGTLQFAVYNHHNGYYGHNIVYEEVKK